MITPFELLRMQIEADAQRPAPTRPTPRSRRRTRAPVTIARASRAPVPATPALPPQIPSPPRMGGRVSVDTESDVVGLTTMVPPSDSENAWRLQRLDTDTFERMSPVKLVEFLVDLSPDIGRALWDFLRMCNPGWTAIAYTPGTDTVNPQGQEALDQFIQLLTYRHGDFNIIPDRLFMGAFIRGAFMSELVLDGAGRFPLEIATPDPASARFKKVPDPVLGMVWQLYQWQGGKEVILDRPTVRYTPIDPLPGSPYGRAIIAPGIFSTIFLLAMLHDIRRVVQQQGYPRLDLQINLEKIVASMPGDLEGNAEAFQKWVQGIVDQVADVYAHLQPDQAYIHTDVVTVNRPVGTVDATSLGGVSTLIEIVTRQLVRGLKTMPLLMAISDRVSEANANRQWEIHVAGIKSVQHPCEVMLETLLTLALQAQGIIATVKFRFAELRTAELLRDAQVTQLNILNAAASYANGWIGQDEAAMMAVGKEKADQPEPRGEMKGASGPLMGGTTNADPGANRSLSEDDILLVREILDRATLELGGG